MGSVHLEGKQTSSVVSFPKQSATHLQMQRCIIPVILQFVFGDCGCNTFPCWDMGCQFQGLEKFISNKENRTELNC